MTRAIGVSEVAVNVRELARQGKLVRYVQTRSDEERRQVRIDAYSLVWPVVFQRLTRRLEVGRGHYRCASSIHRLEPECLDRFHDDVEAALDDLFRNAKTPILRLEGWVSRRLTAATVNAHRRRRGERGALQRPRLPGWLAAGLGHQPVLIDLAVDMLVWVGVEKAAGASVWPLAVWADRRVMAGHDSTRAQQSLAEDVETILVAMRKRPGWYSNFVERPLGRKQAPLMAAPRAGSDLTPEPDYLGLSEPDQATEARLLDLAAAAVDAIQSRLARGENARAVVVDVLATAFGPGTGAEDLDRYPGQGPDAHELVATYLADPPTIDRIVAAVLKVLSTQHRGSRGHRS